MTSLPRSRDVGLVGQLAAAAVAVYALIAVGATTAITDAAVACTTWPACDGEWFAVTSVDLAIVWAHRALAALAGLYVAVVAWRTLRSGESRRVKAAVVAAALAYPVQVGVGAVAATTGTPALVAAVHLALGVGIFGALVAAVAWALEDRTAHLPSAESEGTSRGADEPDLPSSGPLATAYAYFRLMKPRLMWLLCLVASAGMALAAGPALSARTVLWTLLGGVLSIGASGTFNHVLEREKDRRMDRTADRPLATDRIPPRNALAFGLALAVASLVAFAQVNLVAAALGLVAILFYSVVYTLVLKPNTVQNTVVGGFAGALPALIGWAAVTGRVGVPAVLLAGVIFLWTPAHFYNLALAYKDDYAAGGFPMMPVVRGEAATRKHVLYYLGATLASAAALGMVARLGLLYAAATLAFGAAFLWAAIRLHRERDRSAAMRTFHASNAYLGVLLVAIVVDSLAV